MLIKFKINTRRLLYIFKGVNFAAFTKTYALEFCCLGFTPSWHLYFTGPIHICRDEYQIVFKSICFWRKCKVRHHWKCTVASSCLSPKIWRHDVLSMLSCNGEMVYCGKVVASSLIQWRPTYLTFTKRFECSMMYCTDNKG